MIELLIFSKYENWIMVSTSYISIHDSLLMLILNLLSVFFLSILMTDSLFMTLSLEKATNLVIW
jgi:hypothetical protein